MDGDYYVQAEVSTGGFAIELSLNEYDSYYLQPEPVRVYEATNDAALALADLIGPAGHRESLSRSEFEALAPPVKFAGGIFIERISPDSERCDG